MKLSVIICCYNSVAKITPTLNALAKQKVNHNWEIILVDNNSTDGTTSLAKSIWNDFSSAPAIDFITETTPGLSAARKAGILHSTGEYILFCDDDNHLNEDFIENAISIMDNNRNIGALCGKNIPLFEEPIPEIIKENFIAYACGHDDLESGELPITRTPWGAGLVIRSSFMKQLFDLNFKSLLSDRTGNELSSGGDSEYAYILYLLGYKWYYDTRLTLLHDLPQNRLNFEYLKKLFYGFGKANMSIEWYYKGGNKENIGIITSWWKAYLSQKYLYRKNKIKSNDQQAQLIIAFRKGYIDQLVKERKVFKAKQRSIVELLNSMQRFESTTH